MNNRLIALFVFIILLTLNISLLAYISFTSPLLSTDDGFLIKSVDTLNKEGPSETINRMHPVILVYLPSLFYSLSENYPIILINFLSSVFILLLGISFIKERFAKSIFLLLTLCSFSFFDRVSFLAPYPALFLFIFLSFIFLEKYNDCNQKSYLLVSSILLSFSLYIYGSALIFFPTLFLYLILFFPKKSLKEKTKEIIYYCIPIFILTLPWFIWHFLIGGINFYYYPLTWYVVKYLPYVNETFWGYGRSLNIVYLTQFFQTFISEVIPIFFLVFIIPAIFIKNRVIKNLSFLVFMPLFLTIIVIVSPFSRYIYFMIIPLLIISSYFLYNLKNKTNRNGYVIIIALIILLATFSGYLTIIRSQPYSPVGQQYQEFTNFSNLKTEDCAIFGRHYAFQNLIRDNNFLTIQDLNEEDSINLLTGSEEEMIQIMKKYNICYFFIYNDLEKWEINYYGWIPYYFNKTATHFNNLNSNNFEKVYEGKIYTFYHLKTPLAIS